MGEITWQLRIHGDGRERHWADTVLRDFPAYEEFWRIHVVPLTFRTHKGADFKYLRPDQPEEFLDLADANYATFYHLTAAHEWQKRIAAYQPGEYPVPTESLYCFFSHATSMLDSVLSFTHAVNRVLERFKSKCAFELDFAARTDGAPRRYPTRLISCMDGPALGSFKELIGRLSAYRNCLVHKRPVFVHNRFAPRASKIREYSGLSAICKIAAEPARFFQDFEPLEESLLSLTREMRTSLEPIWRFAKERLDDLGPEYRRVQLEVRGRDKELTIQAVRRIRELGRSS